MGERVQALRRRVRLRTRLRRVRDAWRHTRPLPEWSDRPPRVERGGRYDRVVVSSPGALRRRFDGSTTSVQVVVEDWHPPYPGWTGEPAPLPGLRDQRIAFPGNGHGRAAVTVLLAAPLPLAQVVAAVHPAFEPLRRHPGPSGLPGMDAPQVADAPAVAHARPVVDALAVVDAGAANPKGRHRYGPDMRTGVLELGPDGGWHVTRSPDGAAVVAGPPGTPLDDRQRAALLRLGLVTWGPVAGPVRRGDRWDAAADQPGDPPADTAVAAAVLVQLAMTGVVLYVPAASPAATLGGPAPGGYAAVRDVLAPELAAILAEPPPGEDPLAWELRSVRQRRAAIRHHAGGLATPPVSALLVSKRPQLARRTLAAMAAQTYPELEIVVAVHGGPPPADLPAAAGDRPLRLLSVPAGHNLGEALTMATRAAGGQLVTKVDDDDRYGPEHVWDLVAADHYSAATVVGKGADFVHLEAEDLTVRRRMAGEIYTDVVAGGTIMIRTDDLRAAGWWPAVPRHVDRHLLDTVLTAGGLVYRTHPLGFIYTRHGDGHTWQADADYFLRDAQRRWPGLPPYREFGTDG